MSLFSIVCFIIMIILIVQMIAQAKANKTIQPIINLIRKIDDRDAFLEGCDSGIAKAKSEMEKTKYQVLKLWGLSTYGMYEEYDELLPQVNTAALLGNKKAPNDDSLFYMVLAIPNILQKNHDEERADALLAKVKNEVSGAERRLDYQVGMACLDAYFDRNDKGVSFFEGVMDGDYGDYDYQKNLISLYKEVVAAMLYKHYSVTGESEKLEDVKPMAESFNETRIGETWLKNIGAEMPSETEEEDEENSSDETEENTEEEKEEKADEPEDAQETSDGLSETGTSFADDQPEETEDETKEKQE